MKKGLQHKRKTHSKGFTLVELMVSLVIFSTVMVISAGTLLIMIDINAKAQAIYSSTTNLAFALDNMTREIRTGYDYNCRTGTQLELPAPHTTDDCEDGSGRLIAFTREKDEAHVGYRLNQNRIEQSVNGGAWVPLTSEDVSVQVFELTVLNSDSYYDSPITSRDMDQPVVDVFIQGYVSNGLDQETDFSIQSRIVQRRLDII